MPSVSWPLEQTVLAHSKLALNFSIDPHFPACRTWSSHTIHVIWCTVNHVPSVLSQDSLGAACLEDRVRA